MSVQLTSSVVQAFAADDDRSIAFYRLLGLPVPVRSKVPLVMQQRLKPAP